MEKHLPDTRNYNFGAKELLTLRIYSICCNLYFYIHHFYLCRLNCAGVIGYFEPLSFIPIKILALNSCYKLITTIGAILPQRSFFQGMVEK